MSHHKHSCRELNPKAPDQTEAYAVRNVIGSKISRTAVRPQMQKLARLAPSSANPNASQSPALPERPTPVFHHSNGGISGNGYSSSGPPFHGEGYLRLANTYDASSKPTPNHSDIEQPLDTHNTHLSPDASSNDPQWCTPAANHRGRAQPTDTPHGRLTPDSNEAQWHMPAANRSHREQPANTPDVSGKGHVRRVAAAPDKEASSSRKRPKSAAGVAEDGCEWQHWQPGPFHK